MGYALRNRDLLDVEAIHVIREVAAAFENPVLLYWIGKDWMGMLHAARKAFAPAPVPFPLLRIDRDEAGSMEKKKREGYF